MLTRWVSHEIAEMVVVDPNGDHSNLKVCDPYDINCNLLYRNYLDGQQPIHFYHQKFNACFNYMYYISGIARPSSEIMCPAPDSADICALTVTC
jgi:hypothetical protein